ncbi:HNH endonuclease [Planctomycetota bacterium]
MNAYRNTRRSDVYAPYGTCRNCGWSGKDWNFKYTRYCKTCYNEWKKAKADDRRRLKPPNENIEVSEGVVVTRNVHERLKKQARCDIPPIPDPNPKKMILLRWSAGLCMFTFLIGTLVSVLLMSSYPKHATYLLVCSVVAYVIWHICEHIENKEYTTKIKPKITAHQNARLEELARERKRQIDEMKAFYASSEWRLVRQQVIQEQGRVCKECRSHITTDNDLTVDHIKPRSKFPELALVKSNLQILCRRCNSAKGATYNEEVKKEIDDAEMRIREQEEREGEGVGETQEY